MFTIIGNGGSSLLTMPEEGISLEDVKRLTAMMQIQKGVTTIELNAIRNHVDQMKGGKMTRLFSRAQCVHIVITDANHHVIQAPRHDYEGLMTGNVCCIICQRALPLPMRWRSFTDMTPGRNALRVSATICSERTRPLKRSSLRSSEITVSACSALCLMQSISCRQLCGAPENWAFPAISLHSFCRRNPASAPVYASIAKNIEAFDMPFQTPVVLLSSGEMLVTVEKADGIGGRNQEFALQCAREIAGHHRIVMASVDSDGTDGPGGLRLEGAPSCLGGGIVDGYTWQRAQERGVDIHKALKTHATSAALWRLDCGLHIEQNISLNDLTIIYIG